MSRKEEAPPVDAEGTGVLDAPGDLTPEEAATALVKEAEELGLYASHPSHCPFCGVPIGTGTDWENKCHRPGG